MSDAQYLLDDEGELLLYPGVAADITGLPVAALKRKADKGAVRYKRTRGGHRRYYRKDVEWLARRVRRS